MGKEIMYLGSTGFAQVGRPDYERKNQIECAVLTEHLNKKFGKRIGNSGGRLVWAGHQHDFGTYHEMEFHIAEERVTDATWNLVNDMEAFDWEDPELMKQMQALYEKHAAVVTEKIKKTGELHEKAKELERAGAIVMFPEEMDDMLDHPEKLIKQAEAKEKEMNKNSFRFIPLTSVTEDVIMDSVVPACCIYGCTVEPDGRCSHGNPSVLLYHGLI